MAPNWKRDVRRGVDGFYTVCEWVMLRTLIFGCFVYEVAKFTRWLLR